MDIGFVLPQLGPAADPQLITAVAQSAEAAGFDSVWVTDRLLFPTSPQTPYPGTADGSLPAVYQQVYDPLIALTAAALATQRIAIGTCVLNAPMYPPVLLARALSTLDHVSGGRLRVGLGLGWSADEFAAVGVPMHDRGRRCEELVQVLKAIWTEPAVAYAGRWCSIPRSIIQPKPRQRPHPPLYLASFVEAGIARAARLADGWIITGVPLPALSSMIATLHRYASAAGRSPASLDVVVRVPIDLHPRSVIRRERPLGAGSVEQISADLADLAAIGVQQVILDPSFSEDGTTAAGWMRVLDVISAAIDHCPAATSQMVRACGAGAVPHEIRV